MAYQQHAAAMAGSSDSTLESSENAVTAASDQPGTSFVDIIMFPFRLIYHLIATPIDVVVWMFGDTVTTVAATVGAPLRQLSRAFNVMYYALTLYSCYKPWPRAFPGWNPRPLQRWDYMLAGWSSPSEKGMYLRMVTNYQLYLPNYTVLFLLAALFDAYGTSIPVLGPYWGPAIACFLHALMKNSLNESKIRTYIYNAYLKYKAHGDAQAIGWSQVLLVCALQPAVHLVCCCWIGLMLELPEQANAKADPVEEKLQRPDFANQPRCLYCEVKFGYFSPRRHHCRKCGASVCDECAPQRMFKPIPELDYPDPVRHCQPCFQVIRREPASEMNSCCLQ
eukprot:TRINITY_DN2486_c0_g1_i1.p1 TRINITY_DN2486_c0_g1~~TRINITY_DN2486_c0_g1_i1.p1  ORF type:complete len:384 (+),score=36.79 TRINITY_DN2486_c0_g1_i1:147-1154(+)